MQIWLCSQYGRNEETAAAIQLASYAASLGHTVGLLSTTKPYRPVDKYWDSRVVHHTRQTETKLLAGCKLCVWFGSVLPDTAKRFEDTCRHLWVPSQHGLDNNPTAVESMSLIACPTTFIKDTLLRRFPHVKRRVIGIDWAASFEARSWASPIGFRPLLDLTGKYGLTTPVEAAVGFAKWLSDRPSAPGTIMMDRVSGKWRYVIKQLTKSGKLRIVIARDTETQTELLTEHNLLLYLHGNPYLGLVARSAQSLGLVPVAATGVTDDVCKGGEAGFSLDLPVLSTGSSPDDSFRYMGKLGSYLTTMSNHVIVGFIQSRMLAITQERNEIFYNFWHGQLVAGA